MAAVQVAPAPTSKYNAMSILDILRILKWQLQSSLGTQLRQQQKASTTTAGQEIAEINMSVEGSQNLKDDLVLTAADRQWKTKQASIQDVDISKGESKERECKNVKHLSPTATVGDVWDNSNNQVIWWPLPPREQRSRRQEVIRAVKALATRFTMKLATTDVWESPDAQTAWYELEPKEQRQQRVRHIPVPVEVSKADVPSVGETTPSVCSSRQSPAMTSKESPVDQQLHCTAQKKWLRHRQRSVNPAGSHVHGHRVKPCRKSKQNPWQSRHRRLK